MPLYTLSNKQIIEFLCLKQNAKYYCNAFVLFGWFIYLSSPLPQEKISSIPSVVIEPASNNEGEGEEHEVIMNESKDAAAEMGTQGTDTSLTGASQAGSEQKLAEEIQSAPSQDQPVPVEDTASAMPPGFLFKVCFFILLVDVPADLASMDLSAGAGSMMIS